MATTQERIRTIVKGVNQLKNIGPGSDAPIKFIYEKSPLDSMDDDDVAPFKQDFVIKGRLLPQSDLYKERSLGAQIVIETGYPFKPPKVEMTMPMFHPNITKNGNVCHALLAPGNDKWTPTTSLTTVIQEVTKLIDEPSADLVEYTEAANLLDTNREEYERKVAELLRKHGQPR